MANVTVIPATRNFHTGIRKDAVVQKKTAGYARVSTDSEEQQTSYEAQVDYYTNYIKNNPEWEFVGVYTDEGISATGTKHRDGFNQMIQDALMQKSIPMISPNVLGLLISEDNFTDIIYALFATPIFVPQATPVTCVPCRQTRPIS